MLYRLQTPATDGACVVRDFVERWLDQPALRALVERAGGRWPTGDLAARVDALHDFSARWDFRAGAERLQISRGGDDLDGPAITALGAELGMTVAAPPVNGAYDHAIVLGGTALASIYRVRRLFELRANGLTAGSSAVLTALREVSAKELALVVERPEVDVALDGVATEFDVMVRATERYAAVKAAVTREPDENPHLARATARIGDTLVLAAASADPGRRANTRDNYDAYTPRIGAGDSVLIVTSSIYLPYQFFIALQAIGWERPVTIEAIGFPPEWMRGVLTGPENVLQEVRSALYGAQRTLAALQAA